MSNLNSPVMVLNKHWMPLKVVPISDVLSDAVKGFDRKGKIIDGDILFMDEDHNTYPFSKWVEKGFDFDSSTSLLSDDAPVIRCVKFTLLVPRIAIDPTCSKVPDLELKCNRKNLSIRDNNECQYCGKKVYGVDATVDHINPKKHGGKVTWLNAVIACKPCNTRKADKTPEQAGMTLRKQPVKPSMCPITAKYKTTGHSSWNKWIRQEDHVGLTV